MKFKKAVITAPTRVKRLYPVVDTVQKAMLPVQGIDGLYKPVILIIAEEAFENEIKELCIVWAPGDATRYKTSFVALRDNLKKSLNDVDWARLKASKIDNLLAKTVFVEQEDPLGHRHVVLKAEVFVTGEPFLLLLCDYICIANQGQALRGPVLGNRTAGKLCRCQYQPYHRVPNCPLWN